MQLRVICGIPHHVIPVAALDILATKKSVQLAGEAAGEADTADVSGAVESADTTGAPPSSG